MTLTALLLAAATDKPATSEVVGRSIRALLGGTALDGQFTRSARIFRGVARFLVHRTGAEGLTGFRAQRTQTTFL
jgi:hypothetical protein